MPILLINAKVYNLYSFSLSIFLCCFLSQSPFKSKAIQYRFYHQDSSLHSTLNLSSHLQRHALSTYYISNKPLSFYHHPPCVSHTSASSSPARTEPKPPTAAMAPEKQTLLVNAKAQAEHPRLKMSAVQGRQSRRAGAELEPDAVFVWGCTGDENLSA